MEIIESKSTNLSKRIDSKKREMIELGLKYGLTDSRTIRCSQQLDSLLNMQTSMKKLYLVGLVVGMN
ncbi:MAG: aspartyl-phosphate phosphatase Spo0E family protein [Bacillota bacterium]|uniref:Aspartyl-phosphate phosphatase Spo0E family protein n=2 Tax=Virgibacillus TaxID=84406 RepID=A0A941DXX9_9BACI|nr:MULTISPECIES: aspartyl-phosphate phosphatase Spo0E family protein [Bacillaceae]NAZ10296.1 Spo0E family sporulation regulatory protein-aspartic acid phosphatase [Agaribacter marinus]MBR7797587.1 aspartyl-phosphate phosphatase Spo0E family protein [Virgibacillus salarius]MCC2251107.1 aspartyl-phosphate phosphatase Spo0E family protein [Virgibacillus sp. AGTR]MDY7044582.1 aspartyl-phosphate phosphatase Spo0E family protein [Virgibacillus sp. M23]QRZ20149.1 aspartyl-phosphate phosphatase Spo0E 